jgi:hypothetical protein
MPGTLPFADRSLVWGMTGDSLRPWATEIDGRIVFVAVNDFPSESMYTLVAQGDAEFDFDDWPSSWIRVNHGETRRVWIANAENVLGAIRSDQRAWTEERNARSEWDATLSDGLEAA